MEKKKEEQRQYIAEILKQHEEFIVIGLTGRVGSGCSEAADIFGSTYEELELPAISVGTDDLEGDGGKADGLKSDAKRDKRILVRYASHHWIKFDVIRVRTIITSFLLCHMDEFIKEVEPKITDAKPECSSGKFQEELLKKVNEILLDKTGVKRNYSDTEGQEKNRDLKEGKKYLALKEQVKAVEAAIADTGEEKAADKIREWDGYWNKEIEKLNDKDTDISVRIDKYFETLFKELYALADKPEYYQSRAEILRNVDRLLEMMSAHIAQQWWEKNISGNDTSAIEELKKIGTYLSERKGSDKSARLTFHNYMLIHDIIPSLADAIHESVAGKNSSLFTELFQKYGNSIRRFGDVEFSDGEPEQIDMIGDNAFAIPRRINQFIKSLRHPFSSLFARPTRVAIDSIKSVLEATYLRERYSAFYLFAISANDAVRINRLSNNVRKNLSIRDIHFIDWNEYSNYGAEIYSQYGTEISMQNKDNESEKLNEEETFAQIVNGNSGDGTHIVDRVRKLAYKNNLQQFVLQDVGAAIQNADVFISNNHLGTTKNMDLRWEIVRNVSLIMYPGLLIPTPVERCMQIAFAAKANSGCLSRQVGAVVTDSDYNILSVGWNDVPDCDITCARKNLLDIYRERDLSAYSEYEIHDEKFRMRINSIYNKNTENYKGDYGKLLCGLPWRYCFKDVHEDDRQPMRSRAMHAEEKALANVQENAVGGCLFTTSSPCEMCSKNAKHHHISKIYYIEQYLGLSERQYSESGYKYNRASHILFAGAIGRAYTQMYTPVIPHKDVLEFMGVVSKMKECKESVK